MNSTAPFPGQNLSTNLTAAMMGDTTTGESFSFKAVKLSVYVLIFLVSIVGNTLVVVVIIRRRRMRTVINYFIFNLAVADLAMTCICIPFDIPVQENEYRWPYGPILCRIIYPLQTMSLFASVFTLTAVSLNRFWAIVYPLRRQMTKSVATLAIALIWLVSGILTIPYVTVLYIDVDGICNEKWPGDEHRKAYTLGLFVCQYVIPLTVILIAYIRIAIELRKCITSKQSVSVNSVLNKAQQEDAKKVVRMLIIVTLLFAICVLPNNIMWLWLDYGNGIEWPHFWKTLTFTNLILFANSASNPVVYTICHERFRDEFRRYMTCDHRVFKSIQSTFSVFNFVSLQRENSEQTETVKCVLEALLVDSRETAL